MHDRLKQLRDDVQARVNEQQSLLETALYLNDWAEAAKAKARKEQAAECNAALLLALLDIEAEGAQWSDELPTVPGWYWVDDTHDKYQVAPQCVFVRDYAGQLAINNTTLDGWEGAKYFRWIGPLGVPQLQADGARKCACGGACSDAEKATDIAACIDATLAAITARLKAKGAMFEPDAEWCRLQECAGALARAKEALK